MSPHLPPLVADGGKLTRCGGTGEIKYPCQTKTSTAALQSDTGISSTGGRKP